LIENPLPLSYLLSATEPFQLPLIASGTVYLSTSLPGLWCLHRHRCPRGPNAPPPQKKYLTCRGPSMCWTPDHVFSSTKLIMWLVPSSHRTSL